MELGNDVCFLVTGAMQPLSTVARKQGMVAWPAVAGAQRVPLHALARCRSQKRLYVRVCVRKPWVVEGGFVTGLDFADDDQEMTW